MQRQYFGLTAQQLLPRLGWDWLQPRWEKLPWSTSVGISWPNPANRENPMAHPMASARVAVAICVPLIFHFLGKVVTDVEGG